MLATELLKLVVQSRTTTEFPPPLWAEQISPTANTPSWYSSNLLYHSTNLVRAGQETSSSSLIIKSQRTSQESRSKGTHKHNRTRVVLLFKQSATETGSPWKTALMQLTIWSSGQQLLTIQNPVFTGFCFHRLFVAWCFLPSIKLQAFICFSSCS